MYLRMILVPWQGKVRMQCMSTCIVSKFSYIDVSTCTYVHVHATFRRKVVELKQIYLSRISANFDYSLLVLFHASGA